MSFKLKLKVGSKDKKSDLPAPVIKVKPPTLKRQESECVVPEKVKKIKISLSRAPSTNVIDKPSPAPRPVQPTRSIPKLRIKPTRIPGEGYDSEAPDVEDDPLIENGIAIRFLNDANLDFVHSAVDTGDFLNLNIKWITREKAVVNVNLTLYLARLIDLPTLTEIYKTVDKKNIFKTIDISQILLVLRTINPKQLNMETAFEVPEEYTYMHPLYTLSVNNEIKPSKIVFKHGLSLSLEYVYRRLRPRKTNHRLMADIELRVDDLVRRDNEAQESHYEYVDPRMQNTYTNGARPSVKPTLSRPNLVESRSTLDEQTDSEEQEQEQLAQDLEADLDNALERELADALDSTSNTAAATVLMQAKFPNEEDADVDAEDAHGDDDDEDEDEDEENDDDDDDDDDDAVKEDNSRAKKLEEEIAELQKATEKQQHLLATASYKMMRMKFQSNYNHLKTQLDQKKRELAKVREQQQKHQGISKQMPEPEQQEEGEDEEEEEEDEDDEVEDEDDEAENQNRDNVQEAGQKLEDFYNTNNNNNNDDDADDFDEFQGLF